MRRVPLHRWLAVVPGLLILGGVPFANRVHRLVLGFTFLGGSGWAYGRGAPAFYILGYGAIAYAISYFLLPVIWRYATRHHLHSQPDFFVSKYKSPGLGVLVSLVSVAALVPYLVLQL